ncbi:MAG TPA: GNAT family N-acetyltransferase [Candidatus Saccharimonadales bacterium]|nr:GNAT family N-acetyltransferase [Candidatus Saccharimonadales bacterium]
MSGTTGGLRRGRAKPADAGRPKPSVLKFRPVTAARWKDLEALFGERGACGGCWCMAWRLARSEWESGKGAGHRRRLMRIVRSGREPGLLAYSGTEPIGWCAVAPRTEYAALERSRVLKPVDDQPVWSITCLFVKKPFRRMGVSSALLKAAAERALARGAPAVEGYPVIPYQSKAPDAFLWTGTLSAFRKAGFREIHRWSKSRPIMRYGGTGPSRATSGAGT